MTSRFQRILILADIEGTSGCWDYRASSFMTAEWARACAAMTLDVDVVVRALFDAGATEIKIKDLHRTGYNLIPAGIDPRARIHHGYRQGSVPAIGDPGDSEAVMFIGMHAASGSDGFLAHTLTSRIQQLEINGRPLAEIELFASSLAPHGLRPIFFSGCPVACEQAREVIENISVYPIDKSDGPQKFDPAAWRAGLARAAREALENKGVDPYRPQGPFEVRVQMRDGEAVARKLAGRWQLDCEGDRIFFAAADIDSVYRKLIRLCYLTPWVEKALPLALIAYHLWGKIGLAWVRRRLQRSEQF